MITVVGKTGCSACEIAKNILKQKNIDFNYVNLDEVGEEEKESYISLAKSQGKLGLPIILKDNVCYSIQELTKGGLQ